MCCFVEATFAPTLRKDDVASEDPRFGTSLSLSKNLLSIFFIYQFKTTQTILPNFTCLFPIQFIHPFSFCIKPSKNWQIVDIRNNPYRGILLHEAILNCTSVFIPLSLFPFADLLTFHANYRSIYLFQIIIKLYDLIHLLYSYSVLQVTFIPYESHPFIVINYCVLRIQAFRWRDEPSQRMACMALPTNSSKLLTHT